MRPINNILINIRKTYAALLSGIAVVIPAFIIFFYIVIAVLNYFTKEKILDMLILVYSDIDTLSEKIALSLLNFLNIEYSPYLNNISNMLSLKLNQVIVYFSEEIFNITIHITEYAMKLLLASIIAFYLIREGRTIRDTFVVLLPKNKKKTIYSLLQGIDLVFESIILVNILKAIYIHF